MSENNRPLFVLLMFLVVIVASGCLTEKAEVEQGVEREYDSIFVCGSEILVNDSRVCTFGCLIINGSTVPVHEYELAIVGCEDE